MIRQAEGERNPVAIAPNIEIGGRQLSISFMERHGWQEVEGARSGGH